MRHGFLASAGIAIAMPIAVIGVTDQAASAGEYPYPDARDCAEFGNEKCDPDRWNFFQGQCTSGVAWQLNQRNGVNFSNSYRGVRWRNAGNWLEAAREAGIRSDETPAPGAVAWYGRDDNHVAYVKRVHSDGSIVIWEMNYDLHNGVRQYRVRPGDSPGEVGGWPEKFIHVDDLNEPAEDPNGSRYEGIMVRNRNTGAVYLVKADGQRYWVTSGGDFLALRNNGVSLENLSPSQIREIPDSGQRATVERQDEPHVSGPERWIVHRNNTPYGFAGDYQLTESAAGNSRTTNAASWRMDVAPDGVYRVKAFVPKREAVANVVYEVFDGDRLVARVPVDQRQHYGFTTLMERHFDNGTVKVRLRDNAGHGPYGAKMGFDVVEAVPLR
jgi:surface antigen